MASATDIGPRRKAYVFFTAQAGTLYKIAVASTAPNATGTLNLRIVPGGIPDTNPPVVSLKSPFNGSIFTTNRIRVSGTAVDPQPNPSGINRILISITSSLHPERTTLLLSAGALGVGPTELIVERLKQLRHDAQTIVVCGRSEEVKERVAQAVGSERGRFCILGYSVYLVVGAATSPAREQELSVARAGRYGLAQLRARGPEREPSWHTVSCLAGRFIRIAFLHRVRARKG